MPDCTNDDGLLCPHCMYTIRSGETVRCPECGREGALQLERCDRPVGWNWAFGSLAFLLAMCLIQPGGQITLLRMKYQAVAEVLLIYGTLGNGADAESDSTVNRNLLFSPAVWTSWWDWLLIAVASLGSVLAATLIIMLRRATSSILLSRPRISLRSAVFGMALYVLGMRLVFEYGAIVLL